MTNIPKVIAALCLDQFEAKVAAASTATVLRKLIRNTDEYSRLREHINSGSINSSHIKATVEELLESFEKGKPFRYQSALATIAVAMENSFDEYSDEYLASLSKARVTELSMATRVAELAISFKSNCTWTSPRETSGTIVQLEDRPKLILFEEPEEQESMDFGWTEVAYA